MRRILPGATIDYQNAYHFDFIKVMPNGMYFPEAFGQKLKDAEFILDETWQNVEVNAVNDPHEWAKLKVPSMKTGVFAREIEAVKRIAGSFSGRRADPAHSVQPLYLDGGNDRRILPPGYHRRPFQIFRKICQNRSGYRQRNQRTADGGVCEGRRRQDSSWDIRPVGGADGQGSV